MENILGKMGSGFVGGKTNTSILDSNTRMIDAISGCVDDEKTGKDAQMGLIEEFDFSLFSPNKSICTTEERRGRRERGSNDGKIIRPD